MTDRALFDSEFLKRLERLSVRVKKIFRQTGRGDRRSRRKGASPEFAEHRAYQAGDDTRNIDWSVYARTESLFLKQHAGEQDLVVHLLVDNSASMQQGHKFDHARRCAAAFAYAALASGDRVRLQTFADGRVSAPKSPGRGRAGFPAVLQFLSELEATGRSSFGEEIRRFCLRSPAPGLVLVVSDLLCDEGYEEPLKRLLYTQYEPVVMQVLSREELEPAMLGDQDLSDLETAARLPVTVDRSALRIYEQKIRAFLDGISAFCASHEIGHVLAPDDQAVDALFLETLRRAGILG